MEISISLCIISDGKRPEKLKNCLESVKEHVDEINITFTGYNAESEAIAKKCTERITYLHWADDFAHARNFNFSQATKDVILWLDDDDILVDAEKLRPVVNEAFSYNAIGCLFIMYNYERDKNGFLVSQHWRDRIVRNHYYEWIGKIHETMIPITNEKSAFLRIRDFVVEHTEAQINWRDKHERNLRILKKQREEEGDDPDPRTLSYLGKTLYGLHQYDESEKYFLEYIPLSGWGEEIYFAHYYLSKIYQHKKEWQKAIDECFKAMQLDPSLKTIYFELARIHFEIRDYSKCIYWTEEGFKKPHREILLADRPRDYDYNALILLSESLLRVGKEKEAITAYRKLLEFAPNNKAFQKMHNVALHLDEISQTGDAFVKAAEFCAKNEQIAKAEQILDAVPIDVRDLEGIKKERSRIKNIMDRVRASDNGNRKIFDFMEIAAFSETSTEKKYQELLKRLKETNPKKILDVGCYNGWMASALTKEGYKVTGCDISDKVLQVAREKAKTLENPPKFEICEYKNLGTNYHNKFDAVTCFDVLEHVLHPDELIENLEDACKENGWIYINIPNGAWHRGNMDTDCEDAWEHVESYEYRDIVKLLAGRKNLTITKLESNAIRSPGQSSLFIAYQNQVNTGRLIEIFCPYAFEHWYPGSLETGIGGSEEAVINIAKELHNIGYRVIVYNHCGTYEGIYDDIPYVQCESFDQFEAHDIVIAWRYAVLFKFPLTATKKYIWCHDMPDLSWFTPEILDTVDKVLVLSQFHKSAFSGVPDSKLYVTRNGVDLSLFARRSTKRNPYKIVYASSLDRGLEKLLEIWGDVKKAVPKARLHIYYGWNVFDSLRKEKKHLKYKRYVTQLMKQKGVVFHGRIGQKALAHEFLSAGVWAYPTYFPEISCCTGDTLIDMPRDHLKYPLGVPIKELEGKSGFPVYSYNHRLDKIVLSTVIWVAKTRKNAPIWRLILDNGMHIDATPDHQIMLRDGSYEELIRLHPGQDLMPVYGRSNFMIKQNDGTWIDEHRLVGEWKVGRKLRTNEHVNHFDPSRNDNSPNKLEILSAREHHQKTHKGKKRTQQPITKQIKEFKKWCDTDIGKKTLSKHGTDRANKFWHEVFPSWTQEKQREFLDKRVVAKMHNHKVVAVFDLKRTEDVYDMQVEGTANFGANGIIIHNCITAMKAQVAGAIPVCTNYAALAETVKWGITISGSINKEGNLELFKDKLIWSLQHDNKLLRKDMIESSKKRYSWSAVAQDWAKNLLEGGKTK